MQQTAIEGIPFGKGQGSARKTGQAQAQGVEPPLHMGCFPGTFVYKLTPSPIKDEFIGCTTITEGGTAAIVSGQTPHT